MGVIKERRMSKIKMLVKRGYNGAVIGKVFGISRERVRQILLGEGISPTTKDRVIVSQAKKDLIRSLGELGIGANAIKESVLPRLPESTIGEVLKPFNFVTMGVDERASFFKNEEIIYLASEGLGVTEIARVVSTHTKKVKTVLEENGFICIQGSGIEKAVIK